MKKIGIVTYCERDSYGSIMQALALKNKLLQLGYESYILKHPDKNDTSKIEYFIPKTRGQLIILLNRIINKKRIESRLITTNRFIRNNFELIYIDNTEKIDSITNDFCCLLAGSDQIWHPWLCDKLFLLDFPIDIKRISYAASMGITDVPKDKETYIKQALLRFDSISVREYDCQSVIKNIVGKNVLVHIDPTYFFDSHFWETYEQEYDFNRPYILVYPLYWNEKCSEELERLHESSGIDIIAICNDWSRIFATHKLYDVSPGQFLWLIHHAEAVVTSSYHGIAFSVIFHKRLAIVRNPNAPSRIDSIIKMMGIEIINISDVLEEYMDYDMVDKKICKQNDLAEKYLKECLP